MIIYHNPLASHPMPAARRIYICILHQQAKEFKARVSIARGSGSGGELDTSNAFFGIRAGL